MASRAAFFPRGRRGGQIRSGFPLLRSRVLKHPILLRVRYLDCVDGTQLVDIKPFLPTTDCEPGASMGWLERHATRRSPA